MALIEWNVQNRRRQSLEDDSRAWPTKPFYFPDVFQFLNTKIIQWKLKTWISIFLRIEDWRWSVPMPYYRRGGCVPGERREPFFRLSRNGWKLATKDLFSESAKIDDVLRTRVAVVREEISISEHHDTTKKNTQLNFEFEIHFYSPRYLITPIRSQRRHVCNSI